MFYELRINILVAEQDDLDDVLDKLDDLKPQMRVIHPGELNQECSVIDVFENHHDIIPNQPCTLIEHWDNCPEN